MVTVSEALDRVIDHVVEKGGPRLTLGDFYADSRKAGLFSEDQTMMIDRAGERSYVAIGLGPVALKPGDSLGLFAATVSAHVRFDVSRVGDERHLPDVEILQMSLRLSDGERQSYGRIGFKFHDADGQYVHGIGRERSFTADLKSGAITLCDW